MNRRRMLHGLTASGLACALPMAAHAVPVRVRIGISPVMAAAPVLVAIKHGYWRDAGVLPQITSFISGSSLIQALASGTVDMGLAGIAPLAIARARGVDVRVVAAMAVAENTLLASTQLAQLRTQLSSDAEAFSAFRQKTGRRVRLASQPQGSVPHTVLHYWLHEVAHIDAADVEIVPMGVDATQQGFLAAAVDAAMVREPALTILQERVPNTKILASAEALFPDQPGTAVGVSGAFLAKNAALMPKLLMGLMRAVALLQQSPELAYSDVEAVLGKGLIVRATLAAALASSPSHFEIDPRRIMASTRALLAYQMKMGVLQHDLSMNGLFDPSFYEQALVASGKNI